MVAVDSMGVIVMTNICLIELVENRSGALRVDGRDLGHNLAVVSVRVIIVVFA